MVLLPVLATFWCASQCQCQRQRQRQRQRQCSSSISGGKKSSTTSTTTTTTSTTTDTTPLITSILRLRWTVLTGILHGWSIHSKLYPIIYTGSYMTYFATITTTTMTTTTTSKATTTTTTTTMTTTKFPWFEPFKLLKLIQLWIRRFVFQPPFLPLVFFVSTILSFSISTYLAVYWFGDETLEQSLLYHFGRVDHRHNYSMYWYWIYLERSRSSNITSSILSTYDADDADILAAVGGASDASTNFLSLSNLGKILLIPQAVLLVYSSLGLVGSGGGGSGGGESGSSSNGQSDGYRQTSKPQRLALALFVQTYLFVTHNKVITAQYFTWYLCLLPLCCITSNDGNNNNDNKNDGQDNNTKEKKQKIHRMVISLVVLLCSIVFWLLSAYCLEMQGMAVHRVNWIASVCYFAANVNVLGSFLSFFEVDRPEQQRQRQQHDVKNDKKKKT